MVFNDIAKNYDDHSKNFSFLMNTDGNWRLSPAYDISFAFDPNNMWIQRHQLSINGKREGICDDDYFAVAKKMNIKKPNILIERIKDVLSNWKLYAKDCGIQKERISAIEKNINLTKSNQFTMPEIKNPTKNKGLSI